MSILDQHRPTKPSQSKVSKEKPGKKVADTKPKIEAPLPSDSFIENKSQKFQHPTIEKAIKQKEDGNVEYTDLKESEWDSKGIPLSKFKPESAFNIGRFYLLTPQGIIRNPSMDKSFNILRYAEEGQRISLAVFQVPSGKSASKSLVGLLIGIILGILAGAFLGVLIGIGTAAALAIVGFLLGGKMASTKTVAREIPFNDKLATPTNAGGWEAAFDVTTYMQIVVTHDAIIQQKQLDIEKDFTSEMEAINAISITRKDFLKKKESFWQKNAQLLMLMGFTLMMVVIMLAGMYMVSQQFTSSFNTAGQSLVSGFAQALAKQFGGAP